MRERLQNSNRIVDILHKNLVSNFNQRGNIISNDLIGLKRAEAKQKKELIPHF